MLAMPEPRLRSTKRDSSLRNHDLLTCFISIPRPPARHLRPSQAEDYTSSLNFMVKVLDFVKSGGPGRIRTCVAIQGARFTVWWY